MNSKDLQTIRMQLDERLTKVKRQEPLLRRPAKGWIHAVRTSLGLNVRQFAERMGVDKSRISRMEKDELKGLLTIQSLRHAAELLGCELVYTFVPVTKLEEMVREKAAEFLARQLDQSSHTMAMEDQALSRQQKKRLFSGEVERLCKETPKVLWEKP